MGMAETRDAVDLVVVDLPRACRRDWSLALQVHLGTWYAYIGLLDGQHSPSITIMIDIPSSSCWTWTLHQN